MLTILLSLITDHFPLFRSSTLFTFWLLITGYWSLSLISSPATRHSSLIPSTHVRPTSNGHGFYFLPSW